MTIFEWYDQQSTDRPCKDICSGYIKHCKNEYEQTQDESIKQLASKYAHAMQTNNYTNIVREFERNGYQVVGCNCNSGSKIIKRRLKI